MRYDLPSNDENKGEESYASMMRRVEAALLVHDQLTRNLQQLQPDSSQELDGS